MAVWWTSHAGGNTYAQTVSLDNGSMLPSASYIETVPTEYFQEFLSGFVIYTAAKHAQDNHSFM